MNVASTCFFTAGGAALDLFVDALQRVGVVQLAAHSRAPQMLPV